MTLKEASLIVLLVVVAATAWGSRPGSVAADMAVAAQRFLGALAPEPRAAASFAFQDAERANWHFIPRARKGVALKQLAPAQQRLAQAWLASGLSREGYVKAANVMYLESVLFELDNQNPIRDADLYFLSVFGDPSENGTWGWRFEGHHLSLNFTLHGGRVVSASPAFFGANPAVVPQGSNAGMRTLADEELLARELLRSFQGKARAKIVIHTEAPADIITGASRQAEPGPPAGVPLAEMTKEQAAALVGLIENYTHRWRPEVAEAELEKLRKAGLGQIHFAWAGGIELGQPHYYRIQGPTFLIEYDNTQNNANHIHTVWRDLDNDFGADLLRAHYETSPHHRHTSGH